MKFIPILFFVLYNSICLADALSGVKELKIVVERIGKDEIACGISESSIDAAARIPLSNTRIRVNEMISSPHLYLNVQALEIGSMCAVNIEVSFKKWIRSENDLGSFWDKGYIGYFQKINVNNRVSSNIETLTKEFIASWLKSNLN